MMKRFIELLFYVTVGAGMAFGTSSFTMMSGLFELVPSLWVVPATCLAGLFCILISGSLAELASMFPSSPGVRTYLKVGLDDRVSLLLVYLYLIFMILVAGIESYMFALVVRAVFPTTSPIAVVIGLLAFTVIVNLLGLELPRSLQILTTLVLIGVAIVVGVTGAVVTPRSPLPGGGEDAMLAQIVLLPAAVGLAVYLYVGFEWVTMLGFSSTAYERRIPLSMPLAILTNMIAYSAFVIGMAAILPRSVIVATPVPQVPYLLELLGRPGVYVAWGLSVLSIFSTFNAGIMSGSRLIFALTREGNLPDWCATIWLRTGAPVGGIVILGALATVSSVLVVKYEMEILAAVIGSAIVSFVYAAFMLAAIRLRRTHAHLKRSFRTTVPTWVQWVIVAAMPAMGVASLFSQPSLGTLPTSGLILCSAVAAAMTWWSRSRVQTRSRGPDLQARPGL